MRSADGPEKEHLRQELKRWHNANGDPFAVVDAYMFWNKLAHHQEQIRETENDDDERNGLRKPTDIGEIPDHRVQEMDG